MNPIIISKLGFAIVAAATGSVVAFKKIYKTLDGIQINMVEDVPDEELDLD